MGPVFAEAEIDAPREAIFDYLMDLASRPVIFDRDIEDFRLVDLDSKGVGAGCRFRFRRGDWVGMTIVAAERPMRISERGETGRGNRTIAGLEWEIGESITGLSEVRLSYWTEVEGVAGTIDRLTGGAGRHERYLKSALARLRHEVETGSDAVERIQVAGGNRFETGVP